MASGSPRETKETRNGQTPWGCFYDLRPFAHRVYGIGVRVTGTGGSCSPGRVGSPARPPASLATVARWRVYRLVVSFAAVVQKAVYGCHRAGGKQAWKMLGDLGQLPVQPHCEQPEPWFFDHALGGGAAELMATNARIPRSAQVFRVHHPVVALGVAKSALVWSLRASCVPLMTFGGCFKPTIETEQCVFQGKNQVPERVLRFHVGTQTPTNKLFTD